MASFAGVLLKLHPNLVKRGRQPELQLPFEPDAVARVGVHRVREHNLEHRRAERIEFRIYQKLTHSPAHARFRSERVGEQTHPTYPAVLHGHDTERARLQRHTLRVRFDVDVGAIRRRHRLVPQHVGSNKEASVAHAKRVENEELHPVLLRHVDIEEGESDNGSEYGLRQNNHAVLFGDEAQTVVRMLEDSAYATIELGACENDGTFDVHHPGFVQEAEEFEADV